MSDGPGSKSSAFPISFATFAVSLVLAAVAMGWAAGPPALRQAGVEARLIAAFGSALIPVAITMVVGLFTFSEKKAPKSAPQKMLAPTLVFAGLWSLITGGAATSQALQRGQHISDVAAVVAFAEGFVMALALVWALPLASYLLRRAAAIGGGASGPSEA